MILRVEQRGSSYPHLVLFHRRDSLTGQGFRVLRSKSSGEGEGLSTAGGDGGALAEIAGAAYGAELAGSIGEDVGADKEPGARANNVTRNSRDQHVGRTRALGGADGNRRVAADRIASAAGRTDRKRVGGYIET